MKKLFTAVSLGGLAAVCALCGCSPKPVTLWCNSPVGDARAMFEYSAANSLYDGFSRSFSVKDEENFIAYVEGLDGYIGAMQFSDNAERQFYAFLSDSEVFVIYAEDSDGNYEMHSSCYCIDGYYFYYPHAENYWDYSYELDYSGVNSYVTETVQDWEYFKNFYSHVDGAVITDESKTVAFQNVVITVGDGQVFWTIDFGGK